MQLKKKFLGDCKGTLLKFKNLGEQPNVSETTTENNCTTSITTSEPFDANSAEEMQRILDNMDKEEEIYDINFQQCSLGVSSQSEFTKDMIPDSDDMLDT